MIIYDTKGESCYTNIDLPDPEKYKYGDKFFILQNKLVTPWDNLDSFPMFDEFKIALERKLYQKHLDTILHRYWDEWSKEFKYYPERINKIYYLWTYPNLPELKKLLHSPLGNRIVILFDDIYDPFDIQGLKNKCIKILKEYSHEKELVYVKEIKDAPNPIIMKGFKPNIHIKEYPIDIGMYGFNVESMLSYLSRKFHENSMGINND